MTLRAIGIIVGAHGLRGEVVLKPWDEDAPWAETLKTVYVFHPTSQAVEHQIESVRVEETRVIMKLDNINRREEAERLKGADVKAMASDLPALEPDAFYAEDLIGFLVKSGISSHVLGTVSDVLSSNAGDYLEVKSETLSEPVLVPFQTVFVPEVDTINRVITLSGLDSLFEPEKLT